MEDPGGICSVNFILWCSPLGHCFLWLSPPRKILLILLMRTSISHYLASFQSRWPVVPILISKNWSNALLFFLTTFFFFSLIKQKNWEKRFCTFMVNWCLIRWNHDSSWGKCCKFWTRLVKTKIEETPLVCTPTPLNPESFKDQLYLYTGFVSLANPD